MSLCVYLTVFSDSGYIEGIFSQSAMTKEKEGRDTVEVARRLFASTTSARSYAPRIHRAPLGPCYIRVRSVLLFFVLSLFLDVADWHQVHDAGHLSLARACKMTFTTSACPERCPQEVLGSGEREREESTSRRNAMSRSILSDIGSPRRGRFCKKTVV